MQVTPVTADITNLQIGSSQIAPSTTLVVNMLRTIYDPVGTRLVAKSQQTVSWEFGDWLLTNQYASLVSGVWPAPSNARTFSAAEFTALQTILSENTVVALKCTWATKPSPASRIGPLYIEDIGVGGSYWYSNGSTLELTHPTVLYKSGARDGSVTSGTAETLLKNFLIQGGLLGLNRGLRIFAQFSYTNSTNIKTFRTRGNAGVTGLAGIEYRNSQRSVAGTVADNLFDTLSNRASASSQFYGSAYSAAAQAAGVQPSSAFDTSVDWYFSMTGQTATGGEAIHLESYIIELV